MLLLVSMWLVSRLLVVGCSWCRLVMLMWVLLFSYSEWVMVVLLELFFRLRLIWLFGVMRLLFMVRWLCVERFR